MEEEEKEENTEKDTKVENDSEETIEKLLEKRKKDRRVKIILIIIIILLLLIFWLLGYRMGKIGYSDKPVVADPDNNEISIIKVMQDDIQITKDTQLDIFNNSKYNGEKIIAPKSSGTYKFCISNEVEENVVYNIKFLDEMQNFVNMKYRLKIDNIYIRGNEKKYVGIKELNVENITVLKDSNNIFTLEWYWEDSDKKDTFVGSQKDTQYYTLKLEIEASLYNEGK